MSLKRFTNDDIFRNVVVANPNITFHVRGRKVMYNREFEETGSFSNQIKHIPEGHISLYEMNINRPADNLVSRFITKDSSRGAFSTISTSDFMDAGQYGFGDNISSTYPLSASVSRIYVPAGIEVDAIDFNSENTSTSAFAGTNKKYIRALENVLESGYSKSENYVYSNKGTTAVNMICIPSVFYGSKIKEKSITLDYYITGALVGRLEDHTGTGDLIQTYGLNSGSIAGVALYNDGIIMLTGSWNLSADNAVKDKYFSPSSTVLPSWLSFGSGMEEVGTTSAQAVSDGPTFVVKCKGENRIANTTMLAHLEYDEANFSNNPSFTAPGNRISGSIEDTEYKESPGLAKNIKKSSFSGHKEDYEKITYVSKIGIYDENKNLIAIATLANPVKKTEKLNYTFKLGIDF
jgi:hypothetical protein